jgi:hypothetical protein
VEHQPTKHVADVSAMLGVVHRASLLQVVVCIEWTCVANAVRLRTVLMLASVPLRLDVLRAACTADAAEITTCGTH